MTSSLQAHRVDDAQPEDADSTHHHRRHHHHRDPSTETDVELETPKITKTTEEGGDSRAAFFGKVRSMSQRAKATPLDRSEDVGVVSGEKNMSKRLLSATSAALLRVKGVTIRSGSRGQALNPRSVTAVVRSLSPASSSRTARGGGDETRASPRSSLQIASPPDHERAKNASKGGEHSQEELSSSSSSASDITSARGGSTPPSTEGLIRGGDRSKLSGVFDDDNSGETTTTDDAKSNKGSRISITNGNDDKGQAATPPRSRWASTLMTSTLAREKATKATGKTTLGGGIGLLPREQDAGDKVEYLIMVCKAAQTYASIQAPKVLRVRDGQHMINQLRNVTIDLGRQHDKILAVYDTREVRRAGDRLGETLKEVYDLLGDVEATAIMFGRKKGFGKRVSALVHDIGTHANSLLAATSLAIADRPNVLYMTNPGTGEPPAPQLEELIRKCIEGDKYFFGRGEKPSMRKAFEAYSWSAERGCAEAMYMSAWMYGAGSYVETDPEKRRLWLQRAVDKGYAPAMNDLAVILLGEADRLDEAHPQLNADPTLRGPGIHEAGPMGLPEEKREGGNWREGLGGAGKEGGRVGVEKGEEDEQEEEEEEEEEERGGQERGDGSGCSEEASLSPEQAQLFENVMEKRKRAMTLLQEAAKTGHTDAMTNLGNMQEAMGYFEDARNWYSLAAEPSESANNPRAQTYLGTLFYEGRGVTRDHDEAVKWFRRGARQGNPQACQNLGICYQTGVGVAKDLPKAVELFRQAVEAGSISAANSLAYLLARDALHTLATTARLAPPGVAGTGLKFEDPSRGMMKIGELSSEASSQMWRETTAQLREAADLFRRAADHGIADASYQLGRLYQQGLGIPLDPVAAFENFLAAADGLVVHPTAAACVGDMLYGGVGCLRDYGEAMRYYLRAAHSGEAASANAVGLMHELGRGAVRDLEAAREWYERAADLGSADGAFNAALLLERGDPFSAVASAAGLSIPSTRHHASSSSSSPHLPLRSSTMLPLRPRDRAATVSASTGTGGGSSSSSSPGGGGGGRGSGGANSYRHRITQRNQRQRCEASNNGVDDNDGPGAPQSTAAEFHRRGKDDERQNNTPARRLPSASARRNKPGRKQLAESSGDANSLWGDRPRALRMFERAAELGHTGATREVHRLQLRERMDHLVGHGREYKTP